MLKLGNGFSCVLSTSLCAKFLTDDNPLGLLSLTLVPVSLHRQVGQPLTPGDRMAASEPRGLSGHSDSLTSGLGEEITNVKEALDDIEENLSASQYQCL